MPDDGSIIIQPKIDQASWRAQLDRMGAKARNYQLPAMKIDPRPLGQISGNVKEFDKSLQAASARIISFTAITASLYGVGRAFKEMATSAIDTEARFRQMSTLLNTTTAQFDRFKASIFDISRTTATSFTQVAEAATELARQGLSATQVLKRTQDALILTRLSGMNVKESVDAITAALNVF